LSDEIRLLFVDDSASNLLTFGAVLEGEGFDVTTAESGDEARALVDEAGPYHVALIDRNLADEDGLALAAAIRGVMPEMPILIFSGDPTPDPLPEGIHGWLMKGDAIDGLIDRLRAAAKPQIAAS
jgi:DNA-binding NtrC family response regulator